MDDIGDRWWLAKPAQTLATGLMAGLLFVLLVHAFRMAYAVEGNDLTCYLTAAEGLWNGQNPYQIDMPFPYLYPLFLAFALIPLTFIPYWLATAIWLALCTAGLAVGCVALERVASEECGGEAGRRLVVPGLVAMLIFFPPIVNTMIQGQVNPLVLFCCAMFFCSYSRSREGQAGAWLAAAIAIKVLPGVLLAFLLVRRQYRILLWTILFTLLFCALPAVVAGTRSITYYQSYLDGFLLPATTGTMVNTPTHFSFPGAIQCFLPSAPALWLKFFCGGTVVAALAAVETAAFRSRNKRRDIWPFCAYLVGCLLLSPVVELHHLVLAAPAVFLLTVKTFFDRSWTTPGIIFWTVAFVACFDVAARWDWTALSYFASLAILLVLLFLVSRRREVAPQPTPV